ncbi:hypothetical protein HDR63_00030 [bacterium]|nr:hypothetical protein [bacterium]
MFFIQKTLGFMAVLMATTAAGAVTARPSMVTTPGSRMPTMAAYLNGLTSTTVSGGTSGSTAYLENAECIENYTSCLKGNDVCGSDFAECTNKSLFFSKRPLCTSVLMQCSASGIQDLFGVADQRQFANKDANGEYVYPLAGSVLGQLIEASYLANRYDTSTCVKRYTSCLQKTDVCGADFELCTDDTEFKKQKLFCESTLARCESDGIKELFGTTSTSSAPLNGSRLRIMIDEGLELASVNAINTCFRVADQCILNACAANPYKCKEGADLNVSGLVDALNAQDKGEDAKKVSDAWGQLSRNDVAGFIRNACQDTIGGNRFCYMTANNGKAPTQANLLDEDNRNDVFSDLYSKRMNNAMGVKIDQLIENFDNKTKQRCQDTVIQCAMSSCGGGSGLACYNIATKATNSNADNFDVDITRAESSIKSGCAVIVNEDTSCKYAMATLDSTTGLLSFATDSLFEKIFTAPSTTAGSDPLGVVGALNRRLAQNFSPVAMDNLTLQCQNAAKTCARNVCGEDYENCYRNRMDIYSGLTNTSDGSYDKSMNKVGGVLDRTIITGLCLESMKANTLCAELIRAKAYSSNAAVTDGGAVWGSANTVRDAWVNTGSTGLIGSSSLTKTCSADGGVVAESLPATADCGSSFTYTDENNQEQTVTYNSTPVNESMYAQNLAAQNIFQAAISELEIAAQGAYNAKLTQQMNRCLSSNNGGIVGNNENGSTFMWARLKSATVPSNYTIAGLKENQFERSSELYGSFCRVRVSLTSNDKNIQDRITQGNKTWGTAYFAAGDAFTCGSWIPKSELEALTQQVAKDATQDMEERQKRERRLMSWIGASALAVGGGVLGNQMQQGNILGGLTGKTGKKELDKDFTAEKANCISNAGNAEAAAGATDRLTNYTRVSAFEANMAVAKQSAKAMGLNVGGIEESTLATEWRDAMGKLASATTEPDKTTSNATAEKAAAAAVAAAVKLKGLCQGQKAKTDADGNVVNTKKSTYLGTGLTALTTGALGYLAINKIARSVQDGTLDKAEQAAKEEWMDEIGNHIKCVIGSEEVGSYGDIISTSM